MVEVLRDEAEVVRSRSVAEEDEGGREALLEGVLALALRVVVEPEA